MVSEFDSLPSYAGPWGVLILVVVEDGLGAPKEWEFRHDLGVLILVVVEDGLGDKDNWLAEIKKWCLNPCCSGRWSRRNS